MKNNITLTSVQYNKETNSFTIRYFSPSQKKETWIEMDPEMTLEEMINAINLHDYIRQEEFVETTHLSYEIGGGKPGFVSIRNEIRDTNTHELMYSWVEEIPQ